MIEQLVLNASEQPAAAGWYQRSNTPTEAGAPDGDREAPARSGDELEVLAGPCRSFEAITRSAEVFARRGIAIAIVDRPDQPRSRYVLVAV